MSDIPRIGPAPSAQEQMLRRQQEQALEELFQATAARAKAIMSQVVQGKMVPFNVDSVENEVVLAGAAGAAIFAAQQFAQSISMQVGQYIEAQNKKLIELESKVVALEAKLGITK